jgi:hypothetical protein
MLRQTLLRRRVLTLAAAAHAACVGYWTPATRGRHTGACHCKRNKGQTTKLLHRRHSGLGGGLASTAQHNGEARGLQCGVDCGDGTYGGRGVPAPLHAAHFDEITDWRREQAEPDGHVVPKRDPGNPATCCSLRSGTTLRRSQTFSRFLMPVMAPCPEPVASRQTWIRAIWRVETTR